MSCHSILEKDELELFGELKHDVFSLGAYSNPNQHGLPRPSLRRVKFRSELYKYALQSSKENIHPALVEWADAIIMMHNSRIDANDHPQPWLGTENNWEKMKGKPVIWRSIGQSTEQIEMSLTKYRAEGLKIVRYSPKEGNIHGYQGSDALIRFYKDPSEFTGWTGHKKEVVFLAQGINSRRDHVNYDAFLQATEGFPRKVYGIDNADLGEIWGGELDYEQLKLMYRNNRVYFYCGTIPAPYTLSFIEAMMTGIPIVSIGKKLFTNIYNQDTFEVPDLIRNGETGFVSDDIDELRSYIKLLLEDDKLAHDISKKARMAAIGYFGKAEVAQQWKNFLIQFE